jgi:hypothetical protein
VTKKIRGGSPSTQQPNAPKGTELKASTHRHDDRGTQRQSGDRVITHCTCGAEHSSDFCPNG